MLSPYAQAMTGKGHHEMDSHHEVALYPVASHHQMSSNLSGCGQQQTKEINYVQKINYPYLTLVPNNQLYPGSLSTAGLLPCT